MFALLIVSLKKIKSFIISIILMPRTVESLNTRSCEEVLNIPDLDIQYRSSILMPFQPSGPPAATLES